MNFLFNEEQSSLAETVGQVLADFAGLTAPDPARTDDAAVWDALAELGLFSLLVPEANDGVGLSFVDLAPTFEALGAGLAAPIISSTLIATETLKRLGSQQQRQLLLPSIASGQTAIAIAAPEHGLDTGSKTYQLLDGKLSGKTIAVAGADAAKIVFVVAQTAGRPVIAMVPADASGVKISHHKDIDPSAGLCRVVLENVAIAPEQVIGEPSQQTYSLLMDLVATAQSGLAMGVASVMLAKSVSYAIEREQFGKPIGSFQAIKHRCADLAVAVEAGRATTHYAFWACAENANDRSGAASAAKAYCGEIACNACNDAIQIHGGMGFTWELGLHRFLRRAQVIEHTAGNRDRHYERVVAETLAARGEDRKHCRDAA